MVRSLPALALMTAMTGCGERAAAPVDVEVDGLIVQSDGWAAGEAPAGYGGGGNGLIDVGERVQVAVSLSERSVAVARDRERTVEVVLEGKLLGRDEGVVSDPISLLVPADARGGAVVELSIAVAGAEPVRVGVEVHQVGAPQVVVQGFPSTPVRAGDAFAVELSVLPPATDEAGRVSLGVTSESPLLVLANEIRRGQPQEGVGFELQVLPGGEPGRAACLVASTQWVSAAGRWAWDELLCVEIGGPPAGPDLVLYEDRLLADIVLDEGRFDAASCALAEGCVGGPGVRRLLRFDVSTANIGGADLVVGRPAEHPEEFVFSECHDHHHFADFAQYSLERADGTVAATGHKQAFCLEDTDVFPPRAGDPGVPGEERYDCDTQGISRGWYDSYPSNLDCQWVDITDVPAGAYRLRVRINPEGDLPEADLTNNEMTVELQIPPAVDISSPCPVPPDLFSDRADPARNCGWAVGQVAACDPGTVVRLGCTGAPAQGVGCGQGSCAGDSMLRICAGGRPAAGAEPDLPAKCLRGMALRESDNACRSLCPSARFVCPTEGSYSAWTAPKLVDDGQGVRCDLVATAGEVTDACEPEVSDGDDAAQTCGWRPRLTDSPCAPGARHRVGCDPALGPDCLGDSLLRICPADEQCSPATALAQAAAPCPETTFTCPAAGRVSVMSTNPGGAPTEPAPCALKLDAL